MVCGFSIILSFVHVQNSIDFSKSLQGVALPCSKLTEGLDRSQKGKQYFHPVDSGGVAELGSWKVSRRRNLLYMEKVLSSALEGQWTTALEGGIRSCFLLLFFFTHRSIIKWMDSSVINSLEWGKGIELHFLLYFMIYQLVLLFIPIN